VIRLHLIPWSTNVERVALALAHKGIEAEPVTHDPADRSAVRALSGQELVPVLEHDGRVIADSTRIVEYLEELRPDPPLLPRDPARRAETRVWVEWFDRVWKGPPNAIADELERPTPDSERIAALAARMTTWLAWFEALLAGRDFLLGDEFSAADVAAFPFLKYARAIDPADDELFHRVLHDHMPLGDDHPRLVAWIARIDALPRSPTL
jgi:glutathione S-transferase